MAKTAEPNQPIGYWLKRVDNLLTDRINQVQATNGLSRSDWQVLNTLVDMGPVSQEGVFEAMSTFVDTAGLEAILAQLMAKGWAESSGRDKDGREMFQLTDAGRNRHRLVLAAQQEFRHRTMQGIREEEYVTAVRVLQRIASNLGEGAA